MKALRQVARALSDSVVFGRARKLTEHNQTNWNLSLGRWDNLLVSSYLLLHDYGAGLFPPPARDQASVYESETQYGQGLGGISREEFLVREMNKPFWDARSADRYLHGFVRVWRSLDSLGIRPGQHLLELGCGSGWMAELFALAGYLVLATTLRSEDLAQVERRAMALRAKGVTGELSFKLSPMESVDRNVPPESCEAVYIYQALHHAHDWPATLRAARHTLKRDGWLLIADEPNVLHTLLGYRMGKLSGTREIGMSRRKMVRVLREIGYREIRVLAPRVNDWLHPHWIAARQ